jgi:hypothetical protein
MKERLYSCSKGETAGDIGIEGLLLQIKLL